MMRKTALRILKGLLIAIAAVALLIALHIRPDIPVDRLMEEYAGEPSQFVEVGGLAVHYRDEGAGEPVVLLHGALSSLHTWDGWTSELSNEYRVIRLDLPGYGLTGPNSDGVYGFDYYVEFLAGFLDALGIERASIAGNSLGGGITWAFAAQYPERVDKIILLNAAGFISETDEISLSRLLRSPLLRTAARYITPRFLVASFVRQVYGDPGKIDDDTVTRYYRLLRREGNRDTLLAFGGSAASYSGMDIRQALASISAPALILWGDEDSWIPVDNAYLFKESLPGSTLIVYEGAGHVPMEEIPLETVRDVITFLDR